jgi:hypothetical protein
MDINSMKFAACCLVLATMLAVGCGKKSAASKLSHDDYGTLQIASSMFSTYIGENSGKTPPDEQAFRTYLESKQDKLDEQGKTVDELLTSPRNGEPLVFVYGKQPVRGPAGMIFYGYEKAPVDGKRLVLAGRGMYEEMDEAQFRKFFPDTQ